jgi:hypothetical protein
MLPDPVSCSKRPLMRHMFAKMLGAGGSKYLCGLPPSGMEGWGRVNLLPGKHTGIRTGHPMRSAYGTVEALLASSHDVLATRPDCRALGGDCRTGRRELRPIPPEIKATILVPSN